MKHMWELVFVLTVLFIGSFNQGASGFGFGLFSYGAPTHFINCGGVFGVGGLFYDRSSWDQWRLSHQLVPLFIARTGCSINRRKQRTKF
jgi:hypothetical protein